MQNLSFLDNVIANVDLALQTLSPPKARATERPHPDDGIEEPLLSPTEKKHIAGLMRVNHTGEVCAQALYQGQALTATLDDIKDKMNQAALEEIEHLAWCEKRLDELNSNPSHLNPFFYISSLMIGALAGAIGDKWSLGFVVETERQVTKHLEKHLTQLPKRDEKSKAILTQMKIDETHHATTALQAGGKLLPQPIKRMMTLVSKFMTKTTYHI
jgi:3-demethoxyubiquinol 3-hydroxylase